MTPEGSALQPGAYQRDIGDAGEQQRHRQGEVQARAGIGAMETGSHVDQHPAILQVESRGFFFGRFTTC